MESKEEGGPLRRTGPFFGHKDEIIFNPRRNSLADLASWLGQSPAVAGAGVGGVGDTFNLYNDFDNLNTKMDVEETSRYMAQTFRRAAGRG
jgi:hypothetical protein